MQLALLAVVDLVEWRCCEHLGVAGSRAVPIALESQDLHGLETLRRVGN
jgi:hypothetical protein